MNSFKVNADYEMQLFHGKHGPDIINQSLEFLLFFLEEAPLHTHKNYSQEYLAHVEKLTGKTPSIKITSHPQNWWGPLHEPALEREWNSKITSTQFIQQQGWCPETHILTSQEDLKLLRPDKKYLLKDPFGMSGQRFQLFTGSVDESMVKALSFGPLIAEPFLERRFDFSQYVFPDGKLIAYENKVDEKFQYKGSVFNDYQHPQLERLSFYSQLDESDWEEFRQRTHAIVEHYQRFPNKIGYSIDSFVYQQEGRLKIRPMSEINYRRTMGRVAYDLSCRYGRAGGWSALLLLKQSRQSPLWQKIELKEVMVLSPGDTRFEMLFINAESKKRGQEVISKLSQLLPDTQLAV